MHPMKVRRTVRGETILCVPHELAGKIRTEYFDVRVEDERIVFVPLEEVS